MPEEPDGHGTPPDFRMIAAGSSAAPLFATNLQLHGSPLWHC